MSVYSDAMARRGRNRLELARIADEHRKRVAQLEAAIDADDEIILATESGFDAAQFVTARDILWVEWGRNRLITAEVDEVFTAAIDCVRHFSGGLLTERYFGVIYDQHHASLRADFTYDDEPESGVVWFRIGLRESHRGRPLTTEESIACAKWLQALRSGALKLNEAR